MLRDNFNFVQRLQRQDPEAFRVLLDEYDRKIYNIVYRMIPNRTDVDDVAQETFVEIWRALPRFRHQAKLSTWIHRIAVNVCLEHRRRQRGVEDVPLDEVAPIAETVEASPQLWAERSDLKARVGESLRQLPEIYRQVVDLHELQGFTYGEVARILRIPEGTVKSRLNTAFGKLRELLASHLLETDACQIEEAGAT